MLLEFNEFRLTLADDWKQWDGSDTNTLWLFSERRNAGITVSAQFYEVPAEKTSELAQEVLESRESAHAAQFQVPVEYLQRSVKPHSTDAGIEIFYVAQAASEKTFCFLGYVTPRKILSLFIETSECDLDRSAALFSSVVAGYEPKLP